MDVGARLEDAVHAGDESHLLLHLLQRLYRRRELERVQSQRDVDLPRALLPRLGELGDSGIRFAREEAPPHDSDGDVEPRDPLGGSLSDRGDAETLQPR